MEKVERTKTTRVKNELILIELFEIERIINRNFIFQMIINALMVFCLLSLKV